MKNGAQAVDAWGRWASDLISFKSVESIPIASSLGVVPPMCFRFRPGRLREFVQPIWFPTIFSVWVCVAFGLVNLVKVHALLCSYDRCIRVAQVDT